MSSQIWVGMCDFVTHINKLPVIIKNPNERERFN